MQPPGWRKRLSLPSSQASGISDAYSPPRGEKQEIRTRTSGCPCGSGAGVAVARFCGSPPSRQPGLEGSAGCQSSAWAAALIPRKLLVWE